MGNDLLAPCIFLAGCNLRCPYCMNHKLVDQFALKEVDINVIKDYVLKEKSKWFMISGGEPTCNSTEELINLIKTVKEWGCKIGMATNGTNKSILSELLPYLNYVAMDIKSSRDKIYHNIGCTNGLFNVIYSKCILASEKYKRDDFDYEIRTTLFPEFVNREDVKEIGTLLRKDDKWVLQRFRATAPVIFRNQVNTISYTDEEVNELLKIAKNYSDNVVVKYV